MAIDFRLKRNLAERNVEDFIAGRPAVLKGERASTEVTTAGSRDRFINAVRKSAAKFGPGAESAGVEQAGRVSVDLKRDESAELDLKMVRDKQKEIGRTFDFLVGQFVKAGLDKTLAENVARQFSIDDDARKFLSEAAAKSRDTASRSQDLLDSFAKRRAVQERERIRALQKQAFKQQIYRTLFGFAGSVAGGLTAKKFLSTD